jgi:hypothetical protein
MFEVPFTGEVEISIVNIAFEMMKYTTNMIILLLLTMANQYEQSIK